MTGKTALLPLIWTLLGVGIAGGLLAVAIVVFTSLELGLTPLHFCITSACVEYAIDTFDGAVLVLQGTVGFLFLLGTIGGIVIALLQYVNSVESTALSNHIGHFTLFTGYVQSELEKKPFVSENSVDIFHWYNSIFRESRLGNTSVSKDYIALVERLNSAIRESNELSRTSILGSFRYKSHQERMIALLKEFGITVARLPRTDFYDVEDQVLSLIQITNAAFCTDQGVPSIGHREYV